MQPNSNLSINAVEAYPMESFSAENVSSALAEAQKGASSATEHEAAEAKIEVEVWRGPPIFPERWCGFANDWQVLESIQAAMK